MIRNQWYAVLESAEVSRRPIGVLRLGERLVFWRDAAGRVVCLLDRCAHRGAALSAGAVRGDRLQCPFHGLEYDEAGKCRLVPANGRAAPVEARFRVGRYPTHEAHGLIWIFWGDERRAIAPPRFFEDLDDSFTWASLRDPWNAHYSRAIENQLDVSHLPFVHRTTIGRGGATLVDGPVLKWLEADRFRVFVFNRRDDGGRPRKPSELPLEPEPEFHLEFIYPNLWQNHISAEVRVVVAFAPVDENRTILYLRFYQRFVRIPVLRGLVCRLAMPYNRRILHQDRRVVTTQVPVRSDLRIDEELFQADGPIVEYRRRRRELIEEAEAAPTSPPAGG